MDLFDWETRTSNFKVGHHKSSHTWKSTFWPKFSNAFWRSAVLLCLDPIFKHLKLFYSKLMNFQVVCDYSCPYQKNWIITKIVYHILAWRILSSNLKKPWRRKIVKSTGKTSAKNQNFWTITKWFIVSQKLKL